MTRKFLLIASLSVAALSGCGENKDGAVEVLAQKRPAVAPWVEPLLGKPLSAASSGKITCEGATDVVTKRFTMEPLGAIVEGWAWDSEGGKPVPRVLLVSSGLIVGGGDSGRERGDVPKALPHVTTSKVGWQAVATIGSGEVAAFGLTDAGVCPLGAKSF